MISNKIEKDINKNLYKNKNNNELKRIPIYDIIHGKKQYIGNIRVPSDFVRIIQENEHILNFSEIKDNNYQIWRMPSIASLYRFIKKIKENMNPSASDELKIFTNQCEEIKKLVETYIIDNRDKRKEIKQFSISICSSKWYRWEISHKDNITLMKHLYELQLPVEWKTEKLSKMMETQLFIEIDEVIHAINQKINDNDNRHNHFTIAMKLLEEYISEKIIKEKKYMFGHELKKMECIRQLEYIEKNKITMISSLIQNENLNRNIVELMEKYERCVFLINQDENKEYFKIQCKWNQWKKKLSKVVFVYDPYDPLFEIKQIVIYNNYYKNLTSEI